MGERRLVRCGVLLGWLAACLGSSLWIGPGGFGLARLSGRAVAPLRGFSLLPATLVVSLTSSSLHSGSASCFSSEISFDAFQFVSSRIIAQATTAILRASAMPAFLRRVVDPP